MKQSVYRNIEAQVWNLLAMTALSCNAYAICPTVQQYW